jgi:glycosyltransferase involved in cell wall biosynthesis
MHIAFLNVPIEFYSPVSGGALATVIAQMAKAMIVRGHQVTVLTPVNGDPVYPFGKVIPVDAKRIEDLNRINRKLSSLRRRFEGWDLPVYEVYLRSSLRELRRLRPAPAAVVLLNDMVAPKYVKRILPNARILVWFHNEWRTNSRNVATAAACTDRFLTCSDYIRKWMANTTGIPLCKFVVAPNGVDLDAFTPNSAGADQTGEGLRVLFIGRIDPNKGPDIVADAVSVLRAEGVPIRLTVAGGLWFYGHGNEMANPYFRSLKEKMTVAGASYLGHVTRPQVPAMVREYDVVCVLSRANEPFGLVVLEAMASGCAVVASNRGGLPEACDDAAILVNPDEFDSVVSALRLLATNRRILESYKQKSLARAARSSWSQCADVLESNAINTDGVRQPDVVLA